MILAGGVLTDPSFGHAGMRACVDHGAMIAAMLRVEPTLAQGAISASFPPTPPARSSLRYIGWHPGPHGTALTLRRGFGQWIFGPRLP